MIKVFLKDIFDKRMVFRYILFSFLLFFLVNMFLKELNNLQKFSVKSFGIYVIVGLYFSIYFFVRTYIKNDRIMLYYALPISKAKINESFIICILLDTFLRKVLILMAFILNFYINNIFYVTFFLLLPGIIILSCVGNVTNISIIRKFIVAGISIVYMCIVFILSLHSNLILTGTLGLCICFFIVYISENFLPNMFFLKYIYQINYLNLF